MSTSATGPDSGKSDGQGAGDGTADDGAPGSPHAPDDYGSDSGGSQPSPGSRPPYPQQPPGPYQPGAYQPGAYQPGAYQPGPYQAGPYQPGPYQPGPYQPGAYQPDPYVQNPYAQGGQGQGYGRPGQAQGPFGLPYVPQRSRVVAGILGILLGSLGIHRFYLGYTTIGIVQLLLSTVGAVFTFGLSAIAAGIWGLIEGILILVGSEQFRRDAQGIPLRD